MSFWFAMFLICGGVVVIVVALIRFPRKEAGASAFVQDMHGNPMAQDCTEIKARSMIESGEAVLVAEKPLTIRLTRP